ncbi:CRISPR-associated endonuclease Cas1 [Pectinatus brassicae]|uniref:CRISPR-associated endonuclease Cas1 n=1 Tax=Pectinatus brassicae TaxID=862415 RepID=A0A840UR69_9FIRM|nr:CRISPR-associated endonuclease Cas1 [Pectinatus brassicae]MBB5335493.1 CRISPR-associated protein Cas1 [Pectinatus brassicae]
MMSFAYITEEGARIQKKGDKFVVGRNLETIMEIPAEILEGLVLIESVQVSSQAMVAFLQQGIPVTWISSMGKFFGRLESTQHVNVAKHRQQMLMQDTSFAIELSKKIIAAKVHNQIILLRRYNRRQQSDKIRIIITNILAIRKNIITAENKEQLMGYEGIIARLYFEALGQIVPQEFTFSKRSKRPPLDAVNSMLSFGYTLVMYELYTAIENNGLHPYFGFMHALKNHHPALASDLLEEWRSVIVDSMVLGLIQHSEIKIEHFQKSETNGGVYLTREGRNIFLRAYEKKMRTVNKYEESKKSYRYTLNKHVNIFSQALITRDTAVYFPIFIR